MLSCGSIRIAELCFRRLRCILEGVSVYKKHFLQRREMAYKGISSFLILFAAVISISSATSAAEEILQPQAIVYAGVDELGQITPELTGENVNFAVICRSITYLDGEPQNDYRPDINHNCLEASRIRFHDRGNMPPGVSPHATEVCSILLGADTGAYTDQLGPFDYYGTAPDASADVYEFWSFLINNVFPSVTPDADILTADVGTQFEDWWTRGIEAMAARSGIIVISGIGNGSESHDSALYPAAASNAIGVGAVDPVNTEDEETRLSVFAIPNPRHSTAGPVPDGRCKPDIVAGGNCLAADALTVDGYKTTGSWTSFSSPIVAGIAGLLVQKAKQDPAAADAVASEGGNCVIKAILLASASKLPFWHKGRLGKDDDHKVPLDYIQGAGLVNAAAAYGILTAGRINPAGAPASAGWDLNRLTADGPENFYNINTDGNSVDFVSATLAWNRHYSDTYPFEPLKEKDADLRLELWGSDAQTGEYHLLDYSDSQLDNIEHIYFPITDGYTDYRIAVSSNDSGQQYAVAWQTCKGKDYDDILWYDLDADGTVNEKDLAIIVDNLKNSGGSETYMTGDINDDGTIDPNDMRLILDRIDMKADWYDGESRSKTGSTNKLK